MNKLALLVLLVGFLGTSQGIPRRLRPYLPRIVGGVEVAPGEIPFQVVLLYYGEHLCGGSIYNEEWIVTAAHCADYASGTAPYSIIAGLHNLRFPEEDSQPRDVSLKFVHEGYPGSTGFSNDIALFKLSSPLVLSEATRTAGVALAAPGTEVSGKLRVSGWGRLESSGLVPAKLRAVEVSYVDNAACQAVYGSDVDDSMICAGEVEGGKDSCQGDSGGPLTAVVDGTTTLVGVVSWGYGCAVAGYPGVYSRVSYLRDWVLDKIQNN